MSKNKTVENIIMERFEISRIPGAVADLLPQSDFSEETTGMSDSCVLMFADRVLKVQRVSPETDNEARILAWLKGQAQVPECLAYEREGDTVFTLESRIRGSMICAGEIMSSPEKVIRLAAEGLKQLHAVDISGCPCDVSLLDNRLKDARYNVENNLVDVENCEPDTWKRFKDPQELLSWLENNRPDEDVVLTHGDYCLPNVFTDGESVTGFIDLGKCGPADRWQDIALCIRSLEANFNGRYTGIKAWDGFRAEMLTDLLGISVDEEKLRYYILLDELF